MFDRIKQIKLYDTNESKLIEESKEIESPETKSGKILLLKKSGKELKPTQRYLKSELDVFKGTIKMIRQTSY